MRRLLLLASLGVALATGTLLPLESKLQHELLAPCCYRETIDHHMSGAAENMRMEIHELVERGRTERQILDLFKARYGRQILSEPEGMTWWVVTLTPWLLLGAGTVMVGFLIRDWCRPPP